MNVGSVTSAGDYAITYVNPASASNGRYDVDDHVFSPGTPRLSTRWRTSFGSGGIVVDSLAVVGSSLYQVTYKRLEGTTNGTTSFARVGSGWDKFTAIEQSNVGSRTARYGLRNDGVLLRWTNGWKTVSTYPGFAAVKTLGLLSQTATYDTFLATTNGGALYTIHIPASGAAVVKKVRTSTWQGFEKLVLEKCGNTGALLTAIDKDSGVGYVYAVGHANGAATVIKGIGTAKTLFKDPVQLRDTEANVYLNGE